MEASTILPLLKITPLFVNALSNKENILSTNFDLANSFLKFHIVLASGTVSEIVSPKNRMNDNRSKMAYSVLSSLKL